MFSYDEEWALRIQPHHPELDYVQHIEGYYNAFYEQHVPVNFVSADDDFSRYKLLVAPLLYLVSPSIESKLEKFVRSGGHLVLTMRTAVKDRDNKVIPHTLSGGLSKVLGIEIHDYDCLRQVEQTIYWPDNDEIVVDNVSKWCDIITLSGAKALANYGLDYYEQSPAITKHPYGQGMAYYVGTELGQQIMNGFLRKILSQASFPVSSLPSSIEIARRVTENGTYIFAMNHSNNEVFFVRPKEWEPVMKISEDENGEIHLESYAVAIFKSPKTPKT